MTNLFYAPALALLLSTSVGPLNAPSLPIKAETDGARQASSEDEALKEAVELIRKSHFGSEGMGGARIGLARLLEEHRDSRIAYLLSALLDGLQEKEAAHDLSIAMFYMYKRSNYRAAEARLEGILSAYPNYSRTDEVLYQLALLQIETGRGAEAEETLQKLLNWRGVNARARDAQEKLETLRSGK
jgi:hypothetical protein